jgi:hypothetical protein
VLAEGVDNSRERVACAEEDNWGWPFICRVALEIGRTRAGLSLLSVNYVIGAEESATAQTAKCYPFKGPSTKPNPCPYPRFTQWPIMKAVLHIAP